MLISSDFKSPIFEEHAVFEARRKLRTAKIRRFGVQTALKHLDRG